MARDGSGTFNLAQAAFSSGTTIESAKVNSDLSDIASALTQSISKDGQTTYTASQPMGGFKLTGLGAASGAGESVRYDEFKAAFRSLLVGLGMSNNVSPNTKVDVAAGSWTEVGQATVLASVAGTIDCGTTGANGLDAGSLANSTWYHAYAIGKTDLTTALLASTSASSPTMPSGYTLKRRIGSFLTDVTAHIIPFTQVGDEFQWVTVVLDVNDVDYGTSGTTTTQLMTVPTGVVVKWLGNLWGRVTGVVDQQWVVWAYTPGVTTNGSAPTILGVSDNGTNDGRTGSQVAMLTNTFGQIVLKSGNSGTAHTRISAGTLGWLDSRGRNS